MPPLRQADPRGRPTRHLPGLPARRRVGAGRHRRAARCLEWRRGDDRVRAHQPRSCARDPGPRDRLDTPHPLARYGQRRHGRRGHQAVVARDAAALRAGRSLPALRRDRPRRHGRRPQGPRRRPGPRPGRQGPARGAPQQARLLAPVRRGGADRRPAPAPGDRPGLRAGDLRRQPALFHHEAGERPHAGGLAARAAEPARRPGAVPGGLRAGLPDGGLCARPGRDPPRSQAVEHHGGELRRGPGDGLGPGQGAERGRTGR